MILPAKRSLLVILKVALAAVLLALVVRQVHWHDCSVPNASGQMVHHQGLASSLATAGWDWLGWGLLCLLASQLVKAFRWHRLLAAQGVSPGLVEVTRLIFLGELFSTALPGLLSGDVVKVYFAARQSPGKAQVLASAIVNRLIGIATLTGMAVVMLVATWARTDQPADALRAPLVSVCVVVLALGAASAALLSRRVRKRLNLNGLSRIVPPLKHLQGTGRALDLYRRKGPVVVEACLWSVAAQVLGVVSVLMIGWSLDLSTAWYEYFLCVPLVIIIAAVPITPGGAGILENLYLLYFASTGNASQVLALALLARLLDLVAALPGIVALVQSPHPPPREVAEKELWQALDATG